MQSNDPNSTCSARGSEPVDISVGDHTFTKPIRGIWAAGPGNVVGRLVDDVADSTWTVPQFGQMYIGARFSVIRKAGTTATAIKGRHMNDEIHIVFVDPSRDEYFGLRGTRQQLAVLLDVEAAAQRGIVALTGDAARAALEGLPSHIRDLSFDRIYMGIPEQWQSATP